MTATSLVPTDLTLTDPEGRPVRLADLLSGNRFTVVQLVRYFGCLPCQEWCVELDVQAARLVGSGVGAAAVGGSADYQAQWLRDEKGVSMPLLLDPEHQFREAVGAAAPLGVRMLNPRGAASYVGSVRRGYRPQAITRDTVRSPGVVILDETGSVRWQHIGKRIGDYPPVGQVLGAAASLH
ncbi:redoxin domain-containing protein [Nocardioides dilutus]